MESSLTVERLKDVVHYDPDTGIFTRIKYCGGASMVGQQLGCANSAGYLRIHVDGHSYLSHRLAWFYEHGRWPSADIDHINRDTKDNRLSNLREATRTQNMGNCCRSNRNKSGFKGVYKKPGGSGACWIAYISHRKKFHYLGSFKTKKEAISARLTMADQLFGEFARAA